MVETKCIKRPPFGIIKIVLNSYCQLIRTVTPNKEEASWQKIIATQVKILRMDSIHRRKKIRVRTEIQHLIQVRIRIPAKILIQIRINLFLKFRNHTDRYLFRRNKLRQNDLSS